MKAQRKTFWRNRIGICVLHPIRECAGAHYVAVKADGSTQGGVFPRDISPHQPVQDLAALLHEVSPGLWAHVRFNGEVFEMEDQRNWTDASFKTTCSISGVSFALARWLRRSE